MRITKEVSDERTVILGKIGSNLIIRIPVDFSDYLNWNNSDCVELKVLSKNKISIQKAELKKLLRKL